MATILTYRERRWYIRAARDLCYPAQVIDRLNAAKTEEECDRIMRTAREEKE